MSAVGMMTTFLDALLRGQVNLGAVDVRLMLIATGTITAADPNVAFLADVTFTEPGGGYGPGGQVVGGVGVVATGSGAHVTASPVTWPNVTGQVTGCLVYLDTGIGATSRIVDWSPLPSPQNLSADPVTVSWQDGRLMEIPG